MRFKPLRFAGLFAVALLPACAAQMPAHQPRNNIVGQIVRAPTGGEKVVIRDNKGGNVVRMIARRNELEQWGGPVEVRGYCGSACTLFITLPNACLAKDAAVGFHAPRLPSTHIIPTGVDKVMGAYYRNGILDRWNAEWSHNLKIQKISAAEYVRLDPQTRLCR